MIELPEWLRTVTADGWAAVAAFLALTLSIVGVVVRGALALIVARRADVRVSFHHADDPRASGYAGGPYLRLVNVGQATARKIRLEPTGGWLAAILNARWGEEIPHRGLKTGDGLRLPVLTADGEGLVDVTVSWSDGRWRRQKRVQTVSR